MERTKISKINNIIYYDVDDNSVKKSLNKTLNVSMNLNPEGLRKWRENTASYNQMKSDAILGRAEADMLQGMAKMLENSGLSIDIQDRTNSDINVNTKEALKIHTDRIINNN